MPESDKHLAGFIFVLVNYRYIYPALNIASAIATYYLWASIIHRPSQARVKIIYHILNHPHPDVSCHPLYIRMRYSVLYLITYIESLYSFSSELNVHTTHYKLLM